VFLPSKLQRKAANKMRRLILFSHQVEFDLLRARTQLGEGAFVRRDFVPGKRKSRGILGV
jgi:hypothetical protein